jgi:hypothetical protein
MKIEPLTGEDVMILWCNFFFQTIQKKISNFKLFRLFFTRFARFPFFKFSPDK